LDAQHREEMGDKLVMHCRGPNEITSRFNKYVVNGKMFRTVGHDVGKRTQNIGMCVPTIDGLMYYGKLTDIIEVEHYDRTKYVMFKCDWADTTRDKGYKVDEYGMKLVSFNRLVHKGDLVTDDQYVLTSQVDQVFHVEDERNPGWACIVRTKPRNVYNVIQGEGSHDSLDTYHECEPLLLTRNSDQDPSDEFDHVQPDLEPILAYVIE
jgi:hypothetical protein